MLSRVANSIYWMGRYVERAENMARFIDVTLNQILDTSHSNTPQWEPLVRATGDNAYFQKHYGEPTQENVIRFFTFDRDYPNSIFSVLALARENARSVREVISSESWEELNEFYLYVKQAAKSDIPASIPSDFFTQVKRQSHLFNGVTDATMSHGMGWNFLNLARLLERADKTSRILDVKYFTLLPHVADVGTTGDYLQWSAVLRSVSGFEMYRKRYHSLTVRRIVQFLVLDGEFPRAIHFCLNRADDSLHRITGTPEGAFRNAPEQHLGRIRSELAYRDVDSIVDGGLHEYIDQLQLTLNDLDSAIHDSFFALRSPAEATG